MFENRDEQQMCRKLLISIMMDIISLPPNEEWAIYVLQALGCHLSQDGRISGVILNSWRRYQKTRTDAALWRCCKAMWAHLKPHPYKDHDLFIFDNIENCLRDPAYGLTDQDKKVLRELENELRAFCTHFEKYDTMLFELHTPSGRDDSGLHTLLFQLQTGFISESDGLLVNLQGLQRRLRLTPAPTNVDELEFALEQLWECFETKLWQDHFTKQHEVSNNWRNYFKDMHDFEEFDKRCVKLTGAIHRTCYRDIKSQADLTTISEAVSNDGWLVTFVETCLDHLPNLALCKFKKYNNEDGKWKAVHPDEVYFVRRAVQSKLEDILANTNAVNSLILVYTGSQ